MENDNLPKRSVRKEYFTSALPPLRTQNPARVRVQLNVPEKSITDQTQLNDFSMNSIKSKLEKQLPIGNLTNDIYYDLKPLRYTNLQDALTFQQEVQERFDSLPVALRKEMGHDIKNFETYLEDPDNQEKLIHYGIRKPKPTDPNETLETLKGVKKGFEDLNKTLTDKQK